MVICLQHNRQVIAVRGPVTGSNLPAGFRAVQGAKIHDGPHGMVINQGSTSVFTAWYLGDVSVVIGQ